MAKEKYKKGVPVELLNLCAGNRELEKQRLADRVDARCEAVIRQNNGLEVEATEWLKLNKKNMNA